MGILQLAGQPQALLGPEDEGGCACRVPQPPHVPSAEQYRETAPGPKLCPNAASINPPPHQALRSRRRRDEGGGEKFNE